MKSKKLGNFVCQNCPTFMYILSKNAQNRNRQNINEEVKMKATGVVR